MSPGRTVVVAGIGNIFLGDDAFGVELARRLGGEPLPAGVTVTDYGIRGMHLAYDLLDLAPDVTVLLDAVSRGAEPGTVYLLLIEPGDIGRIAPGAVDAHGMSPDVVLALLGSLGGDPGEVLLVGCEPASTGEGMGLSPAVSAALDHAARLVRALLADLGAGAAVSTVLSGQESTVLKGHETDGQMSTPQT